MSRFLCFVALLFGLIPQCLCGATIAPAEDVMTSSFFFGSNTVRGYAGEDRPIHRVSTNNPFGIAGAETIYITFDASSFIGYTYPIASAVLTVTSVEGGQGADAGSGNPFTVSAHGTTDDPLTSITDDTNLSGPISWTSFFANNILPAAPEAIVEVDAFGLVNFDVTALVNSWLSGANDVLAIALTGKNDTSGNDFLHGFLNNTETPGSTFLTVNQVPEPAAGVVALMACASIALLRVRPFRFL